MSTVASRAATETGATRSVSVADGLCYGWASSSTRSPHPYFLTSQQAGRSEPRLIATSEMTIRLPELHPAMRASFSSSSSMTVKAKRPATGGNKIKYKRKIVPKIRSLLHRLLRSLRVASSETRWNQAKYAFRVPTGSGNLGARSSCGAPSSLDRRNRRAGSPGLVMPSLPGARANGFASRLGSRSSSAKIRSYAARSWMKVESSPP
jgi:hypothetical protein